MPKKILIVDDVADELLIIKKRLTGAGHEVITASNGNDAVAMAQHHQPNLIILDLVMPGMDGVETAGILEKDPKTQDIPIIFLTCLLTKDEERSGSLRGSHYFMAKPYNPDKLLDVVEKHCK